MAAARLRVGIAGRELGIAADRLYSDFDAFVADPGLDAVVLAVAAEHPAQVAMVGFFVRFAPTSGGIFMDCSVHDIDLARWLLGRPKALRAFATGSIVLHPGLAACGDMDNGLAITRSLQSGMPEAV